MSDLTDDERVGRVRFQVATSSIAETEGMYGLFSMQNIAVVLRRLAEVEAERDRAVANLEEASAAWDRQVLEQQEVLRDAHDYGRRTSQRAEQAEAERDAAQARLDVARKALASIAANTCCDQCHEAALWARAALARLAVEPSVPPGEAERE